MKKSSKPMSRSDYERELSRIEADNVQIMYKRKLRAAKNKYRKKNKIETNKLMAIYLFALLNAIVIYSMVAMWVFADLSYLGILISDIAAQVLIYAIYCLKAYHGKKQSELIKFQRDKLSGTLDEILEAGSDCEEEVPFTVGSQPEEDVESIIEKYSSKEDYI